MEDMDDFWQDTKDTRKQARAARIAARNAVNQPYTKQRANREHLRCYDWIMCVSGYSYARDRDSFKTYRPIFKEIGSYFIIGVGSVELEVVRGLGDQRTHIITVDNVIHLGTTFCNVIVPKLCSENQWIGNGMYQCFNEDDEASFFGMSFGPLYRLVLAGDPQGYSGFKDGKSYALSLYLSEADAKEVFG